MFCLCLVIGQSDYLGFDFKKTALLDSGIIIKLALHFSLRITLQRYEDFLIFSPLVTLLFVVRASLSSTAFIPNSEETEIKH